MAADDQSEEREEPGNEISRVVLSVSKSVGSCHIIYVQEV
jgi:hypothetical protein